MKKQKVKKLHEFKIRLRIEFQVLYIGATLTFTIGALCRKDPSFINMAIFYYMPFVIWGILNLPCIRDAKAMRKYFIKRLQTQGKFSPFRIIMPFVIAFTAAVLTSSGLYWYTVLMAIIMACIYEYIHKLVKIEQQVEILEP